MKNCNWSRKGNTSPCMRLPRKSLLLNSAVDTVCGVVGRRPWQPSSQPCLIVPLGRWETLDTRFILALEDDSPFWNKLDWQQNKPLSKWKTFSYEYIVSRADSFLHTDTRQVVLRNGLCAYLQLKSRQALCIGIVVFLFAFIYLTTWIKFVNK